MGQVSAITWCAMPGCPDSATYSALILEGGHVVDEIPVCAAHLAHPALAARIRAGSARTVGIG